MVRWSLISRAVLPLSQSPVWNQQRAFYEDNASEAFAEIPHQAVDNPWVAAAYARVIVGFLRDVELDPSQPLYVLELGAGAGRFAHGLARELGERLTQDFVYVLTDFADSQLDDWAAHPGLEDERFDFARVDLTQPIAPVLRRRGTTLRALANPLVVIANYVFDSIPADAFAVSEGQLQACLVDADFSFARAPVTPYGDADLDALLEHYRVTLDDTVFTVPTTAINALSGLRALAGDRLLVLAADKALSTEEALAYRSEPEPARHAGAFSLMVNFHALGFWARRHGGELLHGGDRHAAIDVGAIVFGPSGETRAAYADAIERFGPGDLATLSEGVERAAEELSVAEIVALLRLSGWDASTLHAVLGPLRDQAADADPATQEDLRTALFEFDERHFAVPGDPDLPFAIGLLLYELEDYEDAIEYFEASLEQHGHDPATEKNIELCEAKLV
jgi:tetratricopeptide (TPR) repeat protein